MHKGIKYSQREESQPATTIIKGAKIEDLIIPTSKVYYYYNERFDNSQFNHLNGWSSRSLYPEENTLSPGQLKIMLPIQVKDVVNEYILNFDVKYIYDHPELIVFSED